MIVELIDNLPALVELQPEWSRFTERFPSLTPFQSPEWLITWWRHFGSGTLHVVLFRAEGNICGIIPLFLHEWDGARQLTLIGSGISDYLEPAIVPERSAQVMEHLERHLGDSAEWQVCDWQDLSFDTPLRRLASDVLDETPCSEIGLSGAFAQYWNARSKSLRQNVRRDRQKTESLGQLEFRVSRDAEPELMDALIRLHAARWQSSGEPGMIEANRSGEFLKDVARTFASRGMLRIFSLRFGGEIAAIILAFYRQERLFNYLTAFDPKRESPGLGRTLLFEAIRYAFQNGYRAWNFLRGEEPYKSWWGASPIQKCRVRLIRKA